MNGRQLGWFVGGFLTMAALSACSSTEKTPGSPDAGNDADGAAAPDAPDDASPDATLDASGDSVVDAPLGEGSSGDVIVLFDRARIGSYNGIGWPYQGRATAEAAFDDGPFAKVTLVVDLDSTCFPFEKWTAPPPGQNWPADCDAFDRNFNVVVDEPRAADSGAPPALEVVHAITPFGGPEHVEVDVTDLANGLPGRHRFTVDISAYSDPQGLVTGSNNGWTVSAKLRVTRGPAPHNVLAVVPLYAGVQSSGDVPPTISFDVPAGATTGRIEYRTSGHGGGAGGAGCVGPAEEFCNHPHQVFVDGQAVKSVRTWHNDCSSLCSIIHGPRFDYCLENPCGATLSVVAPRANWCPGSMTPPFVWDDIAALSAPGPHTFSFGIAAVLPGGNWQVSAVYYAFGP